MTKNDRDALRAAVAANIQPIFVRDALTLQLENKRVVLARPNGRKTLFGGLYERETVRQLPRALDNASAPVRIGNNEFLTLREARSGASAPGTLGKTPSTTRLGA